VPCLAVPHRPSIHFAIRNDTSAEPCIKNRYKQYCMSIQCIPCRSFYVGPV
jgi:hypothetical protein